MTTKDTRDDEQRAKALAAESTVKQRIRLVLSEYGPCTTLRAINEIFQWEAKGQPRYDSAAAAVFYARLMGAASLVGDMAGLLGGVPVHPPPPGAGEVGVANRLRLLLGDIARATPSTVQEIGAGCDRIVQLSESHKAMLKATSLDGGAPLGSLVRLLHGERYHEAEGVTVTSIVIDASNEIRRLRELPHAKPTDRILELERAWAVQRDMLVINEGSMLGVLAKLLRGPDALAANPDFFDIVGGAHDEITMLRAQVGRLNDLKARLDVVEGEVKKTSDEYTAARAELRDHAVKEKTRDSVRKSLLSELHEVLIEQVPDIAMSMSADDVVKLATETVKNLAKRRDVDGDLILTKGNVNALRNALRRFTKRSDADLDTLNANGVADGLLVILNDPTETCEVAASAVELLRAALLAHTKDTNPHDTATGFTRQAADVITKQVKQREQVASIIEANAAPLVVTDKLTGHPIGSEAHFAGIRFHCHKTHRRRDADLKQTFVAVDAYTTTGLDAEAIEALRDHAERGAVAMLHAPKATGIEGWATLCSWATDVFPGEDATLTFMLHATEGEAKEWSRNRHGHQVHADRAREDLVKESNSLRTRVGLPICGDPLTLEEIKTACESIDARTPTPRDNATLYIDGEKAGEGQFDMLRVGSTVPDSDALKIWLNGLLKLVWSSRFPHSDHHTEHPADSANDFASAHRELSEALDEVFSDEDEDDAPIVAVMDAGAKDPKPLVVGPRGTVIDESGDLRDLSSLAEDLRNIGDTERSILRLLMGRDPDSFYSSSPEQREACVRLVERGLIRAVGYVDASAPSRPWKLTPLGRNVALQVAVEPDDDVAAESDEEAPDSYENVPSYRPADLPPVKFDGVEAPSRKVPLEGIPAGAHASPFEGKPLDETDPRNMVHALIEEHGSFGFPSGSSLSFGRDGLLINNEPHALDEVFSEDDEVGFEVRGTGTTPTSILDGAGTAPPHVPGVTGRVVFRGDAVAPLLSTLEESILRSCLCADDGSYQPVTVDQTKACMCLADLGYIQTDPRIDPGDRDSIVITNKGRRAAFKLLRPEDKLRFVVMSGVTLTDAETEQNTLAIVRGGTVISTYKGGPPAGGPRTEAALKKLVGLGLAETWMDGNNICYGSKASRSVQEPTARPDECMPTGATPSEVVHRVGSSPFEGKPLDETDPRNMVHALIEEHGSFGFPSGSSLSFGRDGLLINNEPHALNEPFKLIVALLELERAAPSDLKGYGFHDPGMLTPAASNATRDHAAICLAYAGLLHDLRQALQRSLNGLAISAKYNAEKSSDMLAYWTAELARMPIPAAPVKPDSAADPRRLHPPKYT